MATNFSGLLGRMQELRDLSGVIGLCTWDQETYLPKKADEARAAQLSTLQGLYHERLVDPRLGELIDTVGSAASLSEDERAMVRVLRQERDRAVKVPGALVRALAEAQSRGIGLWREARQKKSFRHFAPALSTLLSLRREQADALGHDGERYDALLEAYEPGMRVARLTPVLTALKEKLVPMVAALADARPRREPFPLEGKRFDLEKQWRFTLRLLEGMGFDLEAGRQDRSVHPFSGGTHPTDVRLTTRLFEDNPLSGIFSTIHEGGHGLFEQGFSAQHFRTPLASSPSMGLHESQSRLWENLVGRSRAFWSHYLPELQAVFPHELEGATLDGFLASVNRVSRSPIRVEADEVTYNLHIVLRYELELLLLRGALPVEELPSEWNRRTQALLGFEPTHDVEGVLQDIHWAWGELGYFPTYSLGNLYSASLFAAARKALPELESHIAEGRLRPLREWLRENIHSQGYRTPAEERVRTVTGKGLTDEDFIAYLKNKYGELYGVSLD